MTKKELATKLADLGVLANKVTAEKVLGEVFGVITETVASGETVEIHGFGKFEVVERAEKDGRNPKTGEVIKIAACKAPKFKASKALKDAVNA